MCEIPPQFIIGYDPEALQSGLNPPLPHAPPWHVLGQNYFIQTIARENLKDV